VGKKYGVNALNNQPRKSFVDDCGGQECNLLEVASRKGGRETVAQWAPAAAAASVRQQQPAPAAKQPAQQAPKQGDADYEQLLMTISVLYIKKLAIKPRHVLRM